MRSKRPVLLVALIFAAPSNGDDAGVHSSVGVKKKLRAELLVIGEADAAWIRESSTSAPDLKTMTREHFERFQRLKEIIQQPFSATSEARERNSPSRNRHRTVGIIAPSYQSELRSSEVCAPKPGDAGSTRGWRK